MANFILNAENAPLRSWGFPPLAIAVVSPTRYCIKTGNQSCV
ncbi:MULTISPECIES: hypothetical protein [Moorena]|nr:MULTISPECIES: hypothetical protein [Moorena]